MSEDELARLRELRDFWYRFAIMYPADNAWAKANFDRVDARLRELELENIGRWRAEMISGRDSAFPIPDASDLPDAKLARLRKVRTALMNSASNFADPELLASIRDLDAEISQAEQRQAEQLDAEVIGVPVSAPSPSAGVPVSAPSPSGLHGYTKCEGPCNICSMQYHRVPEKTEREKEEDTYFDITGDPPAGKPTTYKDWRAEYLRTGMSLPFERMMEFVTQYTRTKALDGVDDYYSPVKPRKQKYWHDIDGRPHLKPARGKPSRNVIRAVVASVWILLWISLALTLFL